MADLSPDTSVYQKLSQGPSTMDVGSLLGLIQRSRELNTQSGIADAIRTNPNDPAAAYSAAAKNPNVFMGASDYTNFVHAQSAKAELGRFYTEQLGKGIAGLYAKSISPSKASDNDWNTFAVTASPYISADILDNARKQIVRPDGSLDSDKLATFWNTISGGQQLPQQQYQTATGRRETAPAATFLHGGPAGGGAGGSRGTATISTPAGELTGAGSGQDYVRDFRASQTFNSEVTPVRHIIDALQSGAVTTGRGTEEVQNAKNFMHTFGLDTLFGHDFSKDTAPFEEVRKYMIRDADQLSAGGSNDRLAAAVSGNPNAKLLTLSNLDLAKVNLALRRMRQVGFSEFQKEMSEGVLFNGHALNREDYGDWYAQWAPRQDSRAFVHDMLDPAGRKRVFDSFKTTDEADAYQESWRAMHKNHPEIERAGAP